MDSPLHASDKLRLVYLELTNRCNVRCVYCPQSQPSSIDRVDFPKDRIPELITEFKSRGLTYIRLSGIGETTILKDWMGICEQFLEAGFDLEIVSNLAKRLSPEEILMLCRFKKIFISIDTTDPEDFAQLKRNAKLDQVVQNTKAIISTAEENHLDKPYLLMSIVASDKIIFQIEKTVADAVEMGIDDIYINDLRPYPDVEGACKVRPFWTLPLDQVRHANTLLDSAIKSAQKAGIATSITPRLRQNIDNAISHSEADDSYLTPPGRGETRFCFDPWDSAVFNADGTVSPCCLFPVIYGDVQEQSLEEILDGDHAIQLRKELLTGKLSTLCATCNLRSITPIEDLTKAISARLFMNSEGRLASLINPQVPAWKDRRLLIYGAGGHTQTLFQETDIALAHPLGILDKNARQLGASLCGIPIYPPEAIGDLRPDLILISSFAYQEEIHQELQPLAASGIEIRKIYT